MVAEDDVDVETLQAQIDMSMSFAHDLVTSWIKPAHHAQLGFSGVNTTQILEEELRRPPRLGVGVSVPMIPPLTHGTSKLKCRLSRNRTQNEDVVEPRPQDSDEEECKGRSAKRKTKADPFGHEANKKQRTNLEASLSSAVANNCSFPPSTATLGEPVTPISFSTKEGQRNGPGQRPTISPSGALRETSVPAPGRTVATPVHTDPMLVAKPLGIPLLNLNGPPEPAGKLGSNSELNSTKRKRKRRKKKKTKVVAGTGDKPH